MSDNDLQAASTMAPLLDAITGAAQSTALVILPPAQFPTIIAADKDDILGKLQRELAGFRGDLTTERGRKEIASKAFKVATAKMDLVRLSDRLKEDAQKTIKGINAERNLIVERMDALRDKVRKPLDDFEAREAARVKGHEAAIEDLRLLGVAPEGASSQEIYAALNKLIDLHADRQWQEFEDKAEWVRHTSRTALVSAMNEAEGRERAEAEAARLAAEEAERQRVEAERLQAIREAEIARQAAEAARVAAETAAAEEAARVAAEAAEREAAAERERLRIVREAEEAEARAAAALLAEQARVAEAERRRLEAEQRAENERRATEAREEAARIRGHEAAIAQIKALADFGGAQMSSEQIKARMYTQGIPGPSRDWEGFYPQALAAADWTLRELERLHDEATAREAAEAERQSQLAEQKAEALRLAAIEEERRRVEAVNAETARQAKIREDDKAWRGKINREVVAALLVCGLSEEHAKAVTTALAKEQIPHVSIVY